MKTLRSGVSTIVRARDLRGRPPSALPKRRKLVAIDKNQPSHAGTATLQRSLAVRVRGITKKDLGERMVMVVGL